MEFKDNEINVLFLYCHKIHYMKKKNLLIAIIFITLFSCYSAAQTDEVIFKKLTHDFGTFSEDSEPKVCTFEFTNHQKKAIAISQVQSTCGCAVPEYTKKAIQPGECGIIKITYNPQGRPGKFHRSVLVSFSGQSEKIHLYIKGTVTPGLLRKNKSYPYVIGDLQLRTTGSYFRPMRGNQQQQDIMVVNSGNSPIRMVAKSNIPSVSATMNPSTLAPNQKGVIEIVRQADKNKSNPLCIRIKENAHQQKSAGIVSIIIEAEKCNQ